MPRLRLGDDALEPFEEVERVVEDRVEEVERVVAVRPGLIDSSAQRYHSQVVAFRKVVAGNFDRGMGGGR